MRQEEGVLSSFYMHRPWPPVFLQGDVIEDAPFLVPALPDLVPGEGTSECPIAAPANYSRTRAIIVSATCNLPEHSGGLIQLAPVTPVPDLGRSKREALAKGRNHRIFLLREHDEYGEQIAHLDQIWGVTRENLSGVQRILCLSDWGRSLLADAVHRAFCRPIEDPTWLRSLYGTFLPVD